MRVVCLQHVPFEGPGVFSKALAKRGVSLECSLVPKDGVPPDAGDLLIVMGAGDIGHVAGDLAARGLPAQGGGS